MALHKAMVDGLQARIDAAAQATTTANSTTAATTTTGGDTTSTAGATAASAPAPQVFRPDHQEDRQRLVALLLHCADLHSAAQSADLDRKLAQQVAEEFWQQARARVVLLPAASGVGSLSGRFLKLLRERERRLWLASSGEVWRRFAATVLC